MVDIVLIAGMSGAGGSTAADVLEDLGWYVVDNLPTSLVDTIVELASRPGSDIARLALVSGRQHVEILPRIAALRASGHRVRLVFLDAATPELVRRYDSTRRKHPFDGDDRGLVEAIEAERVLLEPLKAVADLMIDTTALNVHQLKARLIDAFDDVADGGTATSRLQVTVESFGFKHGLPLDADMVLDVRFLPNPHWEPELRPLTGHDPAVRDYVVERAQAQDFLERVEGLLVSTLPAYLAEGKSYLTIAIGCTGGRHRSVALVEELALRLRGVGQPVKTAHRDVGRT